MRDYSDGQFEDRAIVASKQHKGKYCVAKVAQRFSTNDIHPLRLSHVMTMAQARNLLSQGYTTHDVSYLTEKSATITSIWCINQDECLRKLEQTHPGQTIKLLSFDGIAA